MANHTVPQFQIQLRTWIQGPLPLLSATPAAKPFSQTDWPLAPPVTPQVDLRTWTRGYNLNLIGKDRLPTGAIRTELTAGQVPWRAIDLNFGTFYNRNLIGKDRFPNRVTDWPLPIPPADGRTWIQSVNLALTTTVPVKPFKQTDWPINLGPLQPLSVFVASYNRNLIGQDRLPIRQRDWPLPVAQSQDGRSWVQSVNLALTQTQAARPFAQADWPLSTAPSSRDLWIASVNLLLYQAPVVPPDVVPPVTDGGGGVGGVRRYRPVYETYNPVREKHRRERAEQERQELLEHIKAALKRPNAKVTIPALAPALQTEELIEQAVAQMALSLRDALDKRNELARLRDEDDAIAVLLLT